MRSIQRRCLVVLVTAGLLLAAPSCSTIRNALGEYALGAAYQALQDAITSGLDSSATSP